MKCHGCAELEAASKEVPNDAQGVRVVLIPAAGVTDDDE